MTEGSDKRTLIGGVGADGVGIAEADPDPVATPADPFAHLRGSDLAQTQPPATGIEPERNLVGSTIGSYVVQRVLGEGGVGTVYLAEHPIIGSRVAIKVLQMRVAKTSELFSRFVDEARAANAIDSPHIVKVTDFGRLADGQPYAVMECLDGEALDEVLARHERLDAAHACRLLAQAADGLAVAHSQGIIHRDVKPENMFVERGRPELPEFVRILDFGIAKLETAESARKTAQGGLLGTPLYCAPEQIAGGEVTPAVDIYALGAVLYELLSGRPPFEGNVVEVLTKKASAERPDLDRLQPLAPPALVDLVGRMLAADPQERPATMSDVADALASFVDSPAAEVAVESIPDAVPLPRPHEEPHVVHVPRSRVRMWMGLGAAAAVATTIAALSATPSSKPAVRELVSASVAPARPTLAPSTRPSVREEPRLAAPPSASSAVRTTTKRRPTSRRPPPRPQPLAPKAKASIINPFDTPASKP